MASRTRLFVGVLALAFVVSACSNPVGPDGYDPGKPIGSGNVPPCRIDGVPCVGTPLATVSAAVFEGDCRADSASCPPDQERFPTQDESLRMARADETYVVKDHRTVYTVRLRIDHPRVTGREVLARIGCVDSATGKIGDKFEEGSTPTPRYVAVTFDLSFPNGGVVNTRSCSARVSEQDQDLAAVFGTNTWDRWFGFRVQ